MPTVNLFVLCILAILAGTNAKTKDQDAEQLRRVPRYEMVPEKEAGVGLGENICSPSAALEPLFWFASMYICEYCTVYFRLKPVGFKFFYLVRIPVFSLLVQPGIWIWNGSLIQ